MENFFRPEIIIAIVLAILIVFFVLFWIMKRRQQVKTETETLRKPERTADGPAVMAASLSILQSYKNNLNKYGYPYFQETTPFVLQQLRAEADSLVIETKANQQIFDLLQENYHGLANFQQVSITDKKKLELEVLNHVNKTIITWRNYLREVGESNG